MANGTATAPIDVDEFMRQQGSKPLDVDEFMRKQTAPPDQHPDLPGATPALIAAVKAGKTPGAPTQPTATERAGRMDPNERQANEFLLGAASGASGLAETQHPLRDTLKQMSPPTNIGDIATNALRQSVGPVPGIIGSIYHTGKEILSPTQANESEEDAAARRAHGIGTIAGTVAPAVIGEGVSKIPSPSDAVARTLRTEGGAGAIKPIVHVGGKLGGALAGHMTGLPEAGLAGYLTGPQVLENVIPRIAEKPVYPGAPLPSADEFYARRGAEINAMRRMQPQPTIPAIRTSPFEGMTATSPGASATTPIPTLEPPRVAAGPTSTSGVPVGTPRPPIVPAKAPVEPVTYADVPKATVGAVKPPTVTAAAPPAEAPATVAPVEAPKITPAAPSIDEVVNKATGVKPLKANVPIREQLTNMTPPTEAESPEAAAFKAKYPDKPTRQMAMANGERIVDTIGNNPETMKAIHDMTRVDLRQALINAGEDMGQRTVTNSKFAGEGGIGRQDAFNRLLEKGYTPEQIVKMGKTEGIGRIESGENVPQGTKTASQEELKPRESTHQRYFNPKTEEWAPERQAIHDSVAQKAVAGKTPPVGRPPEATITLGGTGSGKTTLTRGLMGEDANRVNVDSDSNKLHVPEYENLKKTDPENAAARVHDESKAISKRTIQEAVGKGLDFVYDTSTGGGGEGLLKRLKDNGYKVKLVYAEVPTEEAINRAKVRATSSADPTNRGRFIPEDVIRDKHTEAAKAFLKYRNNPNVDEIRGFDTTTRTPKEFYNKTGGNEKITDQKVLDAVHEKAGQREPALTSK